MISKTLKNCRICLSKKLKTYIDLGNQPPSNSFIEKKNQKELKFPLRVKLCINCGLSQLDTVVSHKYIFSDYMYLSSTSKALVNHYDGMVKDLIKKYKFKKNDLIIDVGCNDGIILDCYGKKFTNLIGIEPSSAGKYAKKKGYNVIKDFFTHDLSLKIKKRAGLAKLITATNVFAHVDDIRNFTSGIKNLLDKEKGMFVIEFPYLLDMLKDLYYDTIYHEHLSYLLITPISKLFEFYDLRIFNIIKTNLGASGPAVRVFVCSKNSKFKISKNVNKFLRNEKRKKIKKMDLYLKFSSNVKKNRLKLKSIIESLNNKGKNVGAFGAPAKGNTLLNFLNLSKSQILAVAENNKLKINKYTPGTKIKIISDSDFNKLNFDYALLLSWNYLNFFKKNSDFYKNNGKFIVPFPKPKII